MSRLIFPILICVFLISCQKEDTVNPEVPDWFLPQIEEVEKSGECFDCKITQITYDNKYYYNLLCGYWSCGYCKFYDSKGKLVEWDAEEFNNFFANKHNETVIWRCDDK